MKEKRDQWAEYAHRVPHSILEYLIEYAHGEIPHEPGHFLTAVLCNDLMGAYSRADTFSIAAMHDIVTFIYNELPAGSYGSRSAMASWLEAACDRRA